MKKAITLILVLTLIFGSVAAMAQQQPQQPQTGPMMMCPCMMMMQQQMTPEQVKQMQERMAQWWQNCPMMPQQPQAQPKQK